jgi:hypothetical protein
MFANLILVQCSLWFINRYHDANLPFSQYAVVLITCTMVRDFTSEDIGFATTSVFFLDTQPLDDFFFEINKRNGETEEKAGERRRVTCCPPCLRLRFSVPLVHVFS